MSIVPKSLLIVFVVVFLFVQRCNGQNSIRNNSQSYKLSLSVIDCQLYKQSISKSQSNVQRKRSIDYSLPVEHKMRVESDSVSGALSEKHKTLSINRELFIRKQNYNNSTIKN